MSVNDGLTGAWVPNLQPTGRRIVDYSQYRQHATLATNVAAAAFVSDAKGWAASLGGSDGAPLGYSAHLQTGFPFSIACWVKSTSLTESRIIFATDTDVAGTNVYGFEAWIINNRWAVIYGDGTANERRWSASTPTIAVDTWYHFAASFHEHLDVDVYVDGTIRSATQSGTGGTVVHGAGTARIAYLTRLLRRFPGSIADVRTWNRTLNASEVSELYRGGPGYCIRAPRTRYWRAYVPAGATVTGTVAVTLASATASASGTQTISGTSSTTLAAATASASGSLTHSGTGAATLAAATSAASGSKTHSGTAAATLAGATASASGTQTCSGTAAATLAAATCSASGTQGSGILGTVAVTLAAATSTASGSLAYSGTASATTGPTTSTATGTQTCSGSAAAGTGAASCTASGSQTFSGTGSSSLAAATATATGSVSGGPITGTVAVTLGAATATIGGVVSGISGPVFAVDCLGYSLILEAAGETIRVQAETPDTVTTVR